MSTQPIPTLSPRQSFDFLVTSISLRIHYGFHLLESWLSSSQPGEIDISGVINKLEQEDEEFLRVKNGWACLFLLPDSTLLPSFASSLHSLLTLLLSPLSLPPPHHRLPTLLLSLSAYSALVLPYLDEEKEEIWYGVLDGVFGVEERELEAGGWSEAVRRAIKFQGVEEGQESWMRWMRGIGTRIDKTLATVEEGQDEMTLPSTDRSPIQSRSSTPIHTRTLSISSVENTPQPRLRLETSTSTLRPRSSFEKVSIPHGGARRRRRRRTVTRYQVDSSDESETETESGKVGGYSSRSRFQSSLHLQLESLSLQPSPSPSLSSSTSSLSNTSISKPPNRARTISSSFDSLTSYSTNPTSLSSSSENENEAEHSNVGIDMRCKTEGRSGRGVIMRWRKGIEGWECDNEGEEESGEEGAEADDEDEDEE